MMDLEEKELLQQKYQSTLVYLVSGRGTTHPCLQAPTASSKVTVKIKLALVLHLHFYPMARWLDLFPIGSGSTPPSALTLWLCH